MQIVRIVLDLAKYIFEVHGVDARESCAPEDVASRCRVELLYQPFTVPDWYGSVEWRPLLGEYFLGLATRSG